MGERVRYPAVYWVMCMCRTSPPLRLDGEKKYQFSDFCTIVGCGDPSSAMDAMVGLAYAHKGVATVATGRMGEDGDQDGAVIVPIASLAPPGRVELHPWPKEREVLPEYALFAGRILNTLEGGSKGGGRIIAPR